MDLTSTTSTGGDLRTTRALQLMQGFTHRTGVVSPAPQKRYLWTDAFALCNLISLAHATHEPRYFELAAHLVSLVHRTLGRHRTDDWREGWLSGLSELGANTHPTWGGLRIGKPLPERSWDQLFDEQLEWERDGQYFHYLTRWMHALDQLARHTNDPRYNRWARELAAVAFAAFSVESEANPKEKRLVWKMSIDLSRPLVSSSGQHDALDGLVTFRQLRWTSELLGTADEGPSLEEELAGLTQMTDDGDWATQDALGLGSLLTQTWRVGQLEREGVAFPEALLARLLSASLEGLAQFSQSNALARPALARLPFRELGLALGLHALEQLIEARRPAGREAELLEALRPAIALGAELDAFWLDPKNRQAASWLEHRELNDVMLAASLGPEGFLALLPR